MRNRRFLFILAPAFILASPGRAQVSTISLKEKKWANTNCAATSTCDLKEARVRIKDYKVLIDGSYSYGTGLAAHYRTDTVPNLENYVFVQWIQGCTFESRVAGGKTDIRYGVSREFFGKNVTYLHPDPVVDSVDSDPVYNSYEGHPRHYLYQWSRVPGSVERKDRELYGIRKPTTPELYVMDHPGTAFMLSGDARNISLEFKICLYRTQDAPAAAQPEDGQYPGALVCFDWASSYIFNHASGAVESPSGLHPACRVQAPPRPSPEVFLPRIPADRKMPAPYRIP